MITKEADLRSLFKVVTDDLWEMMERLSGYGCNNVVVKTLYLVIRSMNEITVSVIASLNIRSKRSIPRVK